MSKLIQQHLGISAHLYNFMYCFKHDCFIYTCSVQVMLGFLLLAFVWMPSPVIAAPQDAQSDGYAHDYSYEYNRDYNNEYNNGYNIDYADVYSRSGVCAATHRVVLGEYLSGIAAAYAVTVGELVLENGLEDTDLIYENQLLCIPIYSSIAASEKYGYAHHSDSPESAVAEAGPSDDYRKPGIAYTPADSMQDDDSTGRRESNGDTLQPGESRWSSE